MGNNSKKVDESKIFKEAMTQFVLEEDPLLSMMKWMMKQLMKIESELKVGAKKGEHSSERKSYFSGYRARPSPKRDIPSFLCPPPLYQTPLYSATPSPNLDTNI